MASAILFFFATPNAEAQAASRGADRPRTFDVQHYRIKLRFDRAEKTIHGDTTVSLTPLADGLRDVELDAVNLNFENVANEAASGSAVTHKASNERVTIRLARPHKAGETIALRFVYTARPRKGVFFVAPLIENGKEVRSEQIWTQNQPEDARHWFPSFDFPSDKATTEQFINARRDETVIGNGRLVEKIEESDGTVTHHFKMDAPHSTYLVSFIVGKYARIAETVRDVPLGYYVYPGRESIVPKAFASTKNMLAAFEDLTGVKYPFNKYDQTVVSGFEQFSGMENITATSLSDRDVFFAEFDFGKATVEDLVSHELAHSWFGNMVTCRTWEELWLNEGFATFMEAASREKLYGRDSYIRKLRADLAIYLADDAITRRRHALVNLGAKADDSLFDATTYQKGGLVVHMLREEIGDEAFWKGINSYLQKHKFANVVTADLQQAMETASGKNLEWFFRQWVRGAGYPKLEINHTYDARSSSLNVTIRQTQSAANGTATAFRLPLELEIETEKGKRTEQIVVEKRNEQFTFKMNGATRTAVKLDPREKILLKTVKTAAADRTAK